MSSWTMSRVRPTILMMGLVMGAGVSFSAELPPAWQSTQPSKTTTDTGNILNEKERRQPRPANPWYVPRFALGMGANVPELLPIEGYLFFGKYFALRGFYTPPLPINIRIEMPSDVISTKKGVGVANPDFTIHMHATYGAHYGLEGLIFPFGGSFFLAGGVSHRQMRLVGDAHSPVLVCSLLEAAKDPPCGDPNAAIETRTELAIKADALTEATLIRASLGWFWHVGDFGYFAFNAGATKPTAIHRSIAISTSLETESTSEPEITGALAQVKAEREADLRQKALKEMRPVEEKVLPILGISAGVRF